MQDVHVSALHREVSDCLAHMGVAHLVEHLAVDGLFSLDIVLLPDSPTRICIEVDGPYHYTVNTLQPMGHTLIRWAVAGPIWCKQHKQLLLLIAILCSMQVARTAHNLTTQVPMHYALYICMGFIA